MPQLFCFGLSYTAKALIGALRQRDGEQAWTIWATCRDDEGADAAKDFGVHPTPFGSEESRAHVLSSDYILHSIPPGKATPPGKEIDPVLASYSDPLAAGAAKWFAYLSTTGPYGDCGGAWIDETAPINPSGPRGQRRADTEVAWMELASASGLPLHIFRLPGLYGPGRSTFERIEEGTARRIVKEGQVFSRIHIEDLGSILAASMTNPRPGAIYNVADDLPAPPQDIVTYACELLGREPPEEVAFDEADLSPMARSFYSDSKRISNALIKSELGITLKYPTYKEGLKAILEISRGQTP